MKTISVICNTLSLNAGRVFDESDGHIRVIPPEQPMFDQICNWLNAQPKPPYLGFFHYIHGIGTAALCVRWGTYLAVLMDRDKPIDPRAKDPSISMISDSEMMRINIEVSTNLERLFQYLYADEFSCLELLERAYAYLPMPHKRVKRDPRIARIITTSAMIQKSRANTIQTGDVAEQMVNHPYRALANFVALWAYRNGEVENVHAGRYHGYSLAHRRFTLRQEQTIMRETASQLDGIITAPFLWESEYQGIGQWPNNVAALAAGFPFYYPSHWTLKPDYPQVEL
jgi:hypothetical protein